MFGKKLPDVHPTMTWDETRETLEAWGEALIEEYCTVIRKRGTPQSAVDHLAEYLRRQARFDFNLNLMLMTRDVRPVGVDPFNRLAAAKPSTQVLSAGG